MQIEAESRGPSKKELSRRIKALSFESSQPLITPEHWACRERAALRVEYEVAEMQPPSPSPSPAVEAAVKEVLAESSVTYRDDDYPLWRLSHKVRNDTLRHLAAENRLQSALEANPARYSSTLQKVLNDYILGAAPPLDKQNLDQLEATLQVVTWLAGCLPDLPPDNTIRQYLARERFLKPFRFLLGNHFCNREDELKRLREYVGVLDGAGQVSSSTALEPFLMYGIGGIGKSSLIAKFILEHAELADDRRFPYAYLDFNRRDIEVQEPVSILLEVARQLGIQYPLDEKRWESLRRDWQNRLEEYRYAEDIRASEWAVKQQIGFASHRSREWDRYSFEFMKTLSPLLLNKSGQPFLLVLDTFEELLYHDIAYLENLWSFLKGLREQFPSLRLVLSGRSPLPEKYEVLQPPMLLQGLDSQSARKTLLDRGIPETFADQIIEVCGTNPLSLWLAADLFQRNAGDMRAFQFDALEAYLIQGLLYKRILGHIHDPQVRALAHPGMVMRRLTPEIILHVLAEPCQIVVKDLVQAQELFDKLQREVSVVEINQARPDELSQRPELRWQMLELLRRDQPDKARQINQSAVDYFRQRLQTQSPPDIRDQADEVYHRLALNEDPSFLGNFQNHELQRIADELGSAVDDLPERAKPFLAPWSKELKSLDAQVWSETDLKPWEKQTARTVQTLLSLGRYEDALKKLEERNGRSTGSPLYPLHVQVLISLGQLDKAGALLAEGITRSGPNSPERQELLVLQGSLEENQDNFTAALESYRQAHGIAKTLGDHISLLGIQLNILRLRRTQLAPDAPELNQESRALIEVWNAVPDEVLLKNPTVIRNVAAQIGAESEEVVKRAVRLVGLGEKPANLMPLASALASWDDWRSAELQTKPGVLAREIKARPGGNLYQTWLEYVKETPWREVSSRLESLLESHPLPPWVLITFVELIKSRLLLTSEQAGLLQAILVDAFTSDELDRLLVKEFGLPLAEVSRSLDADRQASDLVSWSESKGHTLQLLVALAGERSNHPQLTVLLKSLGLDYPNPGASASREPEPLEAVAGEKIISTEQVGISQKISRAVERGEASPVDVPNAAGTDAVKIGDADITNETGLETKLSDLRNLIGDLSFAVCRGEVRQKEGRSTYFTAFLVGPDLVLTLYFPLADVLRASLPPENVTFRFDLITTKSGEFLSQGQAYTLALGPEAQERFKSKKPWLLAADKSLDYALVRLTRPAGKDVVGGLRQGRQRGWFPLAAEARLAPGDFLGTIFFRLGSVLTVAVQENAFLNWAPDSQEREFRYQLETAPGASGAPILDRQLKVVGLHKGYNPEDAGFGVSVPAVVTDLKRKKLWPLDAASRAKGLARKYLEYGLAIFACLGLAWFLIFLFLRYR